MNMNYGNCRATTTRTTTSEQEPEYSQYSQSHLAPFFCSPFFVIRLRILKLSWGDFLLIFGGGVSEYLQAIFSGRWNSDRVSLCFLGSIYFKGGLTRFHKNSLTL